MKTSTSGEIEKTAWETKGNNRHNTDQMDDQDILAGNMISKRHNHPRSHLLSSRLQRSRQRRRPSSRRQHSCPMHHNSRGRLRSNLPRISSHTTASSRPCRQFHPYRSKEGDNPRRCHSTRNPYRIWAARWATGKWATSITASHRRLCQS